MRVIAGSARRLQLITVPGRDTRPTVDKYKETLFNILQPHIAGASFLDLFAGSGAIGIEALSRGASRAVFVENSRAAAGCIRKNLEHTRLAEKAQVLQTDAMAAVRRLEREGQPFDIIFMDPPYGKKLEQMVISHLFGSPLVSEDTLIAAETLLSEDFSFLAGLGFEEIRRKEYKTNMHIIFRRVK